MSWWEGIKAAFKVLPRLGDTDPYVRITQLEDQVDQEREGRRKAESEVEQLRGELETEASLVPDGTVYWTEDDGERDGPFCTTCYDVQGNLVRMHDLGNGCFMCRSCDTAVEHEAATGGTPRRGGGLADADLPEGFY